MTIWRPENHPDLWRVVDTRPRGRSCWWALRRTKRVVARHDRHEPPEPILKTDPLGDALSRFKEARRA